MSGKLVGRVLDRASTRRATALLVLVAIAERVPEGAAAAWPGLVDLASRTRLTRRSVLRAIKELEEAGDLAIEHRSQRSSVYTVLVGGDSLTPGGVSVARGGDSLAAGGDSLTPEPVGTGDEPSMKPAARGRARASQSKGTTSLMNGHAHTVYDGDSPRVAALLSDLERLRSYQAQLPQHPRYPMRIAQILAELTVLGVDPPAVHRPGTTIAVSA